MPKIQIGKNNFFLLLLFVAILIVALPIVYYSGWYKSPLKQDKPLTANDLPAESYDVVEESEETLVEEFPELPEYSNATLIHSAQYNEEGGEGFSAEYRTLDSVSEVVEWYKEELPKDNWILIYESEKVPNPDFYLIEYKKPDIQLDVHVVELKNGEVKIKVTHHYNMGEYGPRVKYE